MTYSIGKASFEAESRYLTLDLPDSSGLLADPAALRDRIREDGFLLIRGFHDRDEVLGVRREILERLAEQGKLDPAAPLLEGRVNPAPGETASPSVRGRENLKSAALRQLVYGRRTMTFFEQFLGGEPLSFNFQWLRTVGPGGSSTTHYDSVFMGRGTRDLFTLWTPIGDMPPELGPLAICLGSNRWEQVIATYGRSDVDRDLTMGHFTNDPAELVDRFGGRWATAHFSAGDVIILDMFTMHASLANQTNRYRISCDTRYQRADEPIDDRWAGEQPVGHTDFWAPDARLEPVEQSRQRWGV